MPPPIPLIGIIIGTVREGHFGEEHERWIYEIASQRTNLAIELIDLREHNPPFLDGRQPAISADLKIQAAQRWADRLSPLDGVIVVIREYGHGASTELEKALHLAGQQLARKPIGFVGYGGIGSAIGQLRRIAIGLQMVPVRTAVRIGISEFNGIRQQGKTFNDYPFLAHAIIELLDNLAWWAQALKPPRETRWPATTQLSTHYCPLLQGKLAWPNNAIDEPR
ncbi:NADPH-dependent FMN reductase [Pseudomonas fluorescens]|uniref:NADPH-dependent FMN reductase-like domain-containing protein n=1 Tax=Pseudomonas fluorescens TaxID=294 RepID=A0A5E7AJQ2_PSEFL|nr:NAD(P)H-dependent oxidoreductase [Pseudomonas fluorescens]VVN79276.1 hypothetical protein PS704_00967 [Pseudomonas fluorescens]